MSHLSGKHSVFSFGKHYGQTFGDVYKNDKDYVNWAISLPNPNGPLQLFVQFIDTMGKQNPKKRKKNKQHRKRKIHEINARDSDQRQRKRKRKRRKTSEASQKPNKNRTTTQQVKKVEEPAPEFLCPITYELMEDPVIVNVSGWTYERTAIQNWINTHGNDPNTRQQAAISDLIPNRTLRDLIKRWKDEHA
eukprot:18419_1